MNLLGSVKCFTISLGIRRQRITIQDYIPGRVHIYYIAWQISDIMALPPNTGTTAYTAATERKNPKYGKIYSTISVVAGSESLSCVFPYSATLVTEWIFHIDLFQINVYFDCTWLTKSSSQAMY